MIDRRKLMLASLAGLAVPFCAVQAQPGPEERRDEAPAGHGPPRREEEPRREEHERPHMPPPRHEERPRPPGPEAEYHWREGHWDWEGDRWVWIAGRWYR